jgi:calcium-binding protein CML
MDDVQTILKEIDEDASMELDFKEFVAAVKLVDDRHGFTKKDAMELEALYDRYDNDGSGEINADELACALGWFGTPTTIAHAQKIIDEFDDDGSGTLAKSEFLHVMRMRLESEIADLRRTFSEFDQDQSGGVDEDELHSMIRGIGYTVKPSALQELVKDTLKGKNTDMIVFEDVQRILYTLRRQEGFTRSEVEEITDVFKKHDARGSGELRDFELARALHWLGYPLSHQKRQILWCNVDVNKSDSIDLKEFLKLIRLLREEETSVATLVIEKDQAYKPNHIGNKRDSGVGIREEQLRNMINKLGYAPPPALLHEAMEENADTTGDGKIDLFGVLNVLSFIREKQVAALREHSGLPDQTVSRIKRQLKFDKDGRKSRFNVEALDMEGRDPEEIKYFMLEFFKGVVAHHAIEEIEYIERLIKEHCNAAGKLELTDIYQVVRLYGDKQAEDAWMREQDAAKDAGFSSAQVAQYREYFVDADKDGSGFLTGEEIQDVFDEAIALNAGQVQCLTKELQGMGDDLSKYVDFPEFLRLMRVVDLDGDGKIDR